MCLRCHAQRGIWKLSTGICIQWESFFTINNEIFRCESKHLAGRSSPPPRRIRTKHQQRVPCNLDLSIPFVVLPKKVETLSGYKFAIYSYVCVGRYRGDPIVESVYRSSSKYRRCLPISFFLPRRGFRFRLGSFVALSTDGCLTARRFNWIAEVAKKTKKIALPQ